MFRSFEAFLFPVVLDGKCRFHEKIINHPTFFPNFFMERKKGLIKIFQFILKYYFEDNFFFSNFKIIFSFTKFD